MKNNIVVILAIVCLVLGFGGGYYFSNYQFKKLRPNFGNQIPDRQNSGQRQQPGFGGMIMGEVVSQDEKSITIKMQDESTKMVILSESTVYSINQSTDKSEIITGDQIRVIGSANSDGSITAQNIQMNLQENQPNF